MQEELIPNSEDFQYLWLENPIAQEQLQKIVLQRLLRESRSDHINSSPVSKDEEEEPSEPLLIPLVENSGTGNNILKLARVYIGGLVIKLGQKIQGSML